MWLTFDAVSCGYGGRPVLSGVSVRLGTGLWVLLGPNGAGKSALLACAAGVMRPLGGRLLWNGQDAYALAGRYRRHVGYVPQEPLDYADLTPRSLLLYLATLKGIRPGLQAERVTEMLELTGVGAAAGRVIGTLSMGLRARLSLAQALLNDPDILLLDEPAPGLDPGERVRFRNLIQDLGRDRIVLLATNIPEEAVDIAAGVLRLRDGRLSSTHEVLDDGDFDSRAHQAFSGGRRSAP